MKKSGLSDIKKQNKNMIINTILSKGGALSRIEISDSTSLSPSTVSSLITELLDENIISETGQQVQTAGRSRNLLSINQHYGVIAVVEVSLFDVTLKIFNTHLEILHQICLGHKIKSGNDILILFLQAFLDFADSSKIDSKSLKAIGLLFNENIQVSDFNVMYSTGLDSASIPLREAFMTQFHIPVIEEYSQAYTIAHAVKSHKSNSFSNAHIAIGENLIVTGLTVEGKALPLANGSYSDLTCFLNGSFNAISFMGKPDVVVKKNLRNDVILSQIATVIAFLCSLFPLDSIFLSEASKQTESLVKPLRKKLRTIIPNKSLPKILFLEQNEDVAPKLMAEEIRMKVLYM